MATIVGYTEGLHVQTWHLAGSGKVLPYRPSCQILPQEPKRLKLWLRQGPKDLRKPGSEISGPPQLFGEIVCDHARKYQV